MQYILSEEEYSALKKEQEQSIRLAKGKLQKLCTKIADEMPVTWGWGGNDPKPWGCIESSKEEWYCDKCPVQTICPKEWKHYSK